MPPKGYSINRVGERNINHQGLLMEITQCRKSTDIDVKFENGYISKNVSYDNFKKGAITNHLIPSVKGIGIYIPEKVKYKNQKIYNMWIRMIERCFSEKYKEKYSVYKDATCCEEWIYFHNFQDWCFSQSNWNEVVKNPSNFCPDKDILVKGNKVYSPQTVTLVPQNVNKLFTKKNSNRSKYFIGVRKYGNKYMSSCDNPFGKRINKAGFITPQEAFEDYKKNKEMIIKKVANYEYNKGTITKECYEAMMSYKVEITD